MSMTRLTAALVRLSIFKNSGDRCDKARDVRPGLWKLAAISSSTAFGSDVGPGLKLISFKAELGQLSDPIRAGWSFAFIFLFRIVLMGKIRPKLFHSRHT
jgi:hypothetical protein